MRGTCVRSDSYSGKLYTTDLDLSYCPHVLLSFYVKKIKIGMNSML